MSNILCACEPAFLQHDVTKGASIFTCHEHFGRSLVISGQKHLLLKEFVMLFCQIFSCVILPETFAALKRIAASSIELKFLSKNAFQHSKHAC
jgi:hypothetical protein